MCLDRIACKGREDFFFFYLTEFFEKSNWNQYLLYKRLCSVFSFFVEIKWFSNFFAQSQLLLYLVQCISSFLKPNSIQAVYFTPTKFTLKKKKKYVTTVTDSCVVFPKPLKAIKFTQIVCVIKILREWLAPCTFGGFLLPSMSFKVSI